MSNETVTDSNAEALAAAAAYFPGSSNAPAPDAAAEAAAKAQADADKAAAEKVEAERIAAAKPKGPDLSAVVKLPGQKDPAADKPAADDTAAKPDPIDKDLTPPDEKSKSRAGWEELKKRGADAVQKANDLTQQLAARDKELETLRKASPVDDATRARLQELETQNKVFADRLKVLDIRSTPDYLQKFVAPRDNAKTAMADLLKSEELQTNVEELLSLKGKAFNSAVSEVLEQLTPFARVKFQKNLDVYVEAILGGEAAEKQADEFLKNAKSTSGARSRAAFTAVASQFQDVFIPAAVDDKTPDADRAALAGYNAALAAVPSNAEKIAFGQLSETDAASVAHKAALFDFTISQGIPRIAALYGAELTKQQSRIAELEKQVSDMTAARPKISGGSGGGSGRQDDAPPAERSNLEAAREYFPKGA